MKRFKNIITPFITALFFCCLMCCCGQDKDSDSNNSNPQAKDLTSPYSNLKLEPVQGVRSIRVNNIGTLSQVFNDSNHVQLEAAKRMGIDPINGLGESYFMKRPLVKVESNQFYYIDSLSHSMPYLVPEAAQLLEDIGRNFMDSLVKRGGDSYLIKVTSLLRTPETVKNLRKVNKNATDSSTHQYATTFDISHSKFYCLDSTRQINQGDLKNLLGEVLLDLRNQGRCYVKYERKTACYHITVNK